MSSPAPWSPPNPPPSRFATPSLIIRAYVPADADEMCRVVDASRAELLPWMPWAATQHRTPEQAAESIAAFARSALDPLGPDGALGYVFGIFELAPDGTEGELVGGCGIARIIAPTHTAEVGYWVRADRRRRGIATRACHAALDWAFLPQQSGGFGMRRMTVFAAADNHASCAVPPRLGLREYMHATKDRWVEGYGWCDTRAWEVLADEWPGRVRGS